MNEDLAKDFWPQLKSAAEAMGFFTVRKVIMNIGASHGVPAETLKKQFEGLFASSMFQGAEVEIKIVNAGDEFVAPNSDQKMTASGWDILVMKIEGDN